MVRSSLRFLADRFVEGICPHCGYEVWSEPFIASSMFTLKSRMLVVISAIFAAGRWMRLN